MSEHIDPSFSEVVHLIQSARQRAFQAVNTVLIDLYWQVGEYISRKIADEAWGKAVIQQLAKHLQCTNPDLRGFSAQNLWRMRQFYEAYQEAPILSALLRELPWTHNLSILGKCKRPEEREFYLRLAAREKWSSRELDRQISGCLFERVILNPPKVSAALQELHPTAEQVFKDSYLLDFLNLPDSHSESDLQKGLIADLKRFLMELGRDFCFVGEEYLLQVGGRDFRLDLLFYHRELQCLVAFELKIDEFQPESLGKLAFYLEALDRDVKKPQENPSIGVLLCAGKDSEVVEYALNRTLSPAMVADYQTKLPDRALLQRKLAEFYELETTKLLS
jgi:predicted nuclease of restriction endonuclease-like (RecB) superfamily